MLEFRGIGNPSYPTTRPCLVCHIDYGVIRTLLRRSVFKRFMRFGRLGLFVLLTDSWLYSVSLQLVSRSLLCSNSTNQNFMFCFITVIQKENFLPHATLQYFKNGLINDRLPLVARLGCENLRRVQTAKFQLSSCAQRSGRA